MKIIVEEKEVRIGLIPIESCDDCVYSDLVGFDAVCTISNVRHGGKYISKECPLPKGDVNFDILIYLSKIKMLQKENEKIKRELKRFKKDEYNRYYESKAKDKQIENLKMQKSELIETIDFCKDLLYHTNNSKRMKELRKNLSVWVNDEC